MDPEPISSASIAQVTGLLWLRTRVAAPHARSRNLSHTGAFPLALFCIRFPAGAFSHSTTTRALPQARPHSRFPAGAFPQALSPTAALHALSHRRRPDRRCRVQSASMHFAPEPSLPLATSPGLPRTCPTPGPYLAS
eukprot:scaffold17017_cov79-Isochrysis_galbana.AAC.1